MSVSITFRNVVKRYGNNTVIPSLSLRVKQGELFTLLGPSGCGKTTLLRMVAGFNSIEGGEILFNDQVINHRPPQKRNIGMVFQNYALFPHMTVEKNVAFGLENRKVPKSEIPGKVERMLVTVQIANFRKRLPENLSGGQQQRVALARAIVMEPDVLLMDEPLSNLDAKLRIEMRNAIREIQEKFGITTIYVTHDQEEAMAISDRIGVMRAGELQHVGTPQNIYHRPANVFVASFIGRANIIERPYMYENGRHIIKLSEGYRISLDNIIPGYQLNTVKVSIRPEEFIFSKDEEGINGIVESSMFLGLNTHYFVKLEGGETVEIIQESTIEKILEPGTQVKLKVKEEKINVFDRDTGKSIIKGVVNDAESNFYQEV
ncbi:MAG: polyamine ABC transporter ATP-binding protein [Caldibacillus debilis]|uniref:Polyamine ABC transporter ATP-binding protein n=1 Tax=Caldibacillus debilis TaxID=301148 RepID=A0A3E0K0N9_9BACI|nr:ABC transporter ATP-binding protein [Caldibacillus debilis]REJ26450.1 MAG: polyamine ABC transporter ATP-binding protein [Caldibacillus debilis]